ncbi:lipoprotein [Leifsonia bigeumensis]|uniref:Lipoprotein n=1 Tax=Leifsonella bigeumensis TaxID=433643 RepID=A0ABP7FJK0_9MICO
MPTRGAAPAPLRDRFRYWFDNIMARGTIAVMGLLGVATLLFIAVIALVVVVFGFFPPQETGDDDPTFFEILWGNLMRTLDPGTMGTDRGWGFRAAMLVVTIGGLIMVASLIGIISSAFDRKVEDLRKGRSRVLEADHTLILGWSQKVLPIVSELCIANESRRRPAIVVLANRDKVELEDELKAVLPRNTSTRIIVRSGDPMDLGDLELGNPHSARSIILVAPEGSEDPDSVVIKMALALTNNPRRGDGVLNIVGELQDARNLEAATLVGRDEVSWVLTRDLISRITVQTCRQSGLSAVYTELLDFEGDEIYFTAQPTLAGKTYFDAQLAFAESCVFGIARGETVMINPDAATVLTSDDRLIVISTDDSAVKLGTPGTPDPAAITGTPDGERRSERTLVLGCNSDLGTILQELDEYVSDGSQVTIVAEAKPPKLPELGSLEIEYIRGDTTSRAMLESLDVPSFDHIIVLAYKEMADAQRADAKTLVTLLHLREIGENAGAALNIVSEMLDDRNREIAEVTKADDFIVSDKLISLALSQLSENRILAKVFDSLFSSEGSEIYLKPVDRYVRPGEPVDFYTLLEAARRRGETAIGYRIVAHAHDAARGYGVLLNPPKGERVSFAASDRIVVLAED